MDTDNYIKDIIIWLTGPIVEGKESGPMSYWCKIKSWNELYEKDEELTLLFDIPEDINKIEDKIKWGNKKALSQLSDKLDEAYENIMKGK